MRLVVASAGVHPHDKFDVIFRWTTYPTKRKSPVLVSGGPRGVRTGGPKGGTDLPIFRILGVLRSDVSNQSGRRLQYKSSTFEEIWTTLARKFPIPIFYFGFPANPSGRRFLYKSFTFEEIGTTLDRKYISDRKSLGYRQIRRAGVYCINRPLSKISDDAGQKIYFRSRGVGLLRKSVGPAFAV